MLLSGLLQPPCCWRLISQVLVQELAGRRTTGLSGPARRRLLSRAIDIRELRVTRGSLPRRALALVLEWAVEHRQALLEDWDLCSQLKPPKPIPPLE